jgi:WD40 repeat protein
MVQPIKIFISSPGDVTPERRRAALIIEKLAKDYARFFEIKPYLWETEPMLASGHFQDAILAPENADIVILILWSRLGTPLPERTHVKEYRGMDGRAPVTGTEWEFESALAANRRRGIPDLLAYKKKEAPKAEFRSDAELQEVGRQWRKLEAFWRKHFVDHGSFRAAFSEFEDLEAFEAKLDRDLRRLIERRVGSRPATEDKAPSPIWLKGSPFLGLESYRFEHAPIFFGRSNAIKTAVEQLVDNAQAGRPFLLVVGASGAGKSSLAQAGIVPALCTRGVVPRSGQWRRAVMHPGGHPEGPFAALAEALTGSEALPELLAGHDLAALAHHLEASATDPSFPIVAALLAREKAARKHADLLSYEQVNLVLVVDQFEELFTRGAVGPGQRNRFILLLHGLMHSGRIFVVGTMRSDYWHRVADFPLLIALVEGYGHVDLLPPTQAEIAEMIRRPAEAGGLKFEQEPRTEIGLDATLAEEGAREPGALPLLSFILDALYATDVKTSGNSTLTYASMRQLGGLKGAIAARAEAAFTSLPADVQAAFPKVLRAVVTVSRSGAEPTARAALLARFPEQSAERKFIDTMLDPQIRLMVVEGKRDGEGAHIRLAHEALITHWGRAQRQIAQDRDDLRTRTSVEEAEAEWRSTGGRQKRGYLLRNPQLANAIDLVRRWGDELPHELRNFIRQSDAAAKIAARRRWAAAALVMICLAALAAASLGAFYVAETQRIEALISQSRFLARDARPAVAGGNATLGALLALAALPKDLRNPDRPFVMDAEHALEQALANQREQFILAGHIGQVRCAAFSRDGTRAVTGGSYGTARLWDVKTGTALFELQGHTAAVVSAAFSPDGSRVVTASSDDTARLWNAKTGAAISVLRGHGGPVISASFSPDGSRVVTASEDNTGRLWNATTGAQIAVLQHEEKLRLTRQIGDEIGEDGTSVITSFRNLASVTSAAFSPDGALIVTSSKDETARVWDGRTGAEIAVLRGHETDVNSAAFSSDGRRIVTASEDSTARLWDARTGMMIRVLRGHLRPITTATFSPDGTRVVTASSDNTARLWEVETGRTLVVLSGHGGGLTTADFSPDGVHVLTASEDGTARLWSAASGAVIAVLRGHAGSITSAAFSPVGTLVLTAAYDNARLWTIESRAIIAALAVPMATVNSAVFSPDGALVLTTHNDSTARLWDARTGAEIIVLRGHKRRIESVSFSPDGSRVVTASGYDDVPTLWDANTGEALAVLGEHNDGVISAAFSPTGMHVVTASQDGTAKVWDVKTRAVVAVLRGHHGRVNSAAFSPDGSRVLTVSDDKTARLWDVKTASEVTVLRGHDDGVSFGQFAPDGTRIVTGYDEKKAAVRLWDAETGAPIAVLQHDEAAAYHPENRQIASAAFSPNSMRLVTAYNASSAYMWDAKTGAAIAVLRGHETWITSAAFSPDSTQVVTTASRDHTARLWKTESATPIAVLQHQEQVTSASFSPDGLHVLTNSRDYKARVWRVPRCQALIDLARAELPRDLTEQERTLYFLEARTTNALNLHTFLRPWLAFVLPRADTRCDDQPER